MDSEINKMCQQKIATLMLVSASLQNGRTARALAAKLLAHDGARADRGEHRKAADAACQVTVSRALEEAAQEGKPGVSASPLILHIIGAGLRCNTSEWRQL
jgi:hypothetical protein